MSAANATYLTLNLLMYAVTFILYQRKKDYLSVGALYLLYLVMTCILAFICFVTPNIFYTFNDLKLFPFIYLFAALIITALPILRLDEKNTSIIQPSSRALNLISIAVIIMSVLQLIDVIQTFQDGIGTMIWDIRSGAELYSEMLSNADESGKGISNIFAIIGGSFSNLAILFAFIYLTREKPNYLIIIGLIICFATDIMSSIGHGARGNVVLKSLTVIFAYWLTRKWMTEKMQRRVGGILAGIILMVSIPVLMLTISRFSDHKGLDKAASSSIIYYSGQSMLNFNNYGLDAGGIRYGDRTANLFKRIVKPDTPVNYSQRRAKYSNLKIDDYYFYTFVGDFTIDYGPVWAMIIFIIATLIFLRLTKPTDGKLTFHQVIVLYFVLCVCCQGVMCLFSFSDTAGGLKIITTILTYLYFKYDYMRTNSLIKI